MVFVKAERKSVDKPLMENKVVGSERIIHLAAMDVFAEARFIVDRQYIEIMVADLGMVPIEDDIRIEALVEPVEEIIGQRQDLQLVHRKKIHFVAVVQKTDGILYRTHEAGQAIV